MKLPKHWVIMEGCEEEATQIAEITGTNPLEAIEGIKGAASVLANLICDVVDRAKLDEAEAMVGLNKLSRDMMKVVKARFANEAAQDSTEDRAISKEESPELHALGIDLFLLVLATVEDCEIEIVKSPDGLITMKLPGIALTGPGSNTANVIDELRQVHADIPKSENAIFDKNLVRLTDALQKAVLQ